MTQAELAALSDAAGRPGMEGAAAYNQFVLALVNAYRANHLAVIGPDAVDRVARALDKALAFDVELDVRVDELTHEERCKIATAAIAALTERV